MTSSRKDPISSLNPNLPPGRDEKDARTSVSMVSVRCADYRTLCVACGLRSVQLRIPERQSMEDALYYEHSNRFSASTVAVGVGGSLIGSAALGVVYGYLTVLTMKLTAIPVLGAVVGGFDLMLALGFGATLAAATEAILRQQHVRHKATIVVTSLISAVMGLYVAWAAWVTALLPDEVTSLSLVDAVLGPASLFEVVKLLNAVGAWTFMGIPFSGFALWCVWIAEVGIVVGIGTFAAVGSLRDRPFCEQCQVWCEKQAGVVTLEGMSDEDIRARLESKTIDSLLTFVSDRPTLELWHVIDLDSCPRCQTLNTLDVRRVTKTIDKDGEVSEDSADVLQNLLLTERDVDVLRMLSTRSVTQTTSVALTASVGPTGSVGQTATV